MKVAMWPTRSVEKANLSHNTVRDMMVTGELETLYFFIVSESYQSIAIE